jgi:hypothetical protein
VFCGGGEQQPFPGALDGTHPLEERTEGCGVARHETRLAQPGWLGIAVALTGCPETKSRYFCSESNHGWEPSPWRAITYDSHAADEEIPMESSLWSPPSSPKNGLRGSHRREDHRDNLHSRLTALALSQLRYTRPKQDIIPVIIPAEPFSHSLTQVHHPYYGAPALYLDDTLEALDALYRRMPVST